MCSLGRAGKMRGWSLRDQWISCVSTIWWPAKSGLQTLSFTMGRNQWHTTWPCPISSCVSRMTALCFTQWGESIYTVQHVILYPIYCICDLNCLNCFRIYIMKHIITLIESIFLTGNLILKAWLLTQWFSHCFINDAYPPPDVCLMPHWLYNKYNFRVLICKQ